MAIVKSVEVQVSGDSSGAQKALGDLGTKSSSVGSSIKKSLSGLFNAMANTGIFGPLTSTLEDLSSSFDGLELKGKNFAKAMEGIGTSIAGVGATLTVFSQGDKDAEVALGQVFKNAGSNIDDYKGKIEETQKSMAKYGYTNEQTDAALGKLVQATKNPKEALADMGVAANLAASQHISLESAATKVVQVLAGKGTRTLQQYGLQVQGTAVTTKTLSSDQSKLASDQSKVSSAIEGVDSKLASLGASHKATNKQVEAAIDAYNAYTKLQDSGKASTAQLKSAYDKYNTALDAMNGKTPLTISQQMSLKSSQDKVTAAQAALATQTTVTKKAQDAMKNSATQGKGSLDQLSKSINGDAAVAASTFTGKMKALRAEFENGAAELGQKYGPAITAVGVGMTGLGTAINGAKSIIGLFSKASDVAKVAEDGQAAAEGIATAATTAETTALGAEDVAEGIALAPILAIIAAVALLGVGIYELVTHWKTVWGDIKSVVGDIVSFIKAHWALILPILTGPFAPFIIAFEVFHKQILGFFEALPGDIKKAIGSLLNLGSSLMTEMLQGIEGAWAAVAKWFSGIYSDVKRYIGSLVGIGEGMIDNIWTGIDNYWHYIATVFTGVYTGVKNAIGSLVGIGETIIDDIWTGVDKAWNGFVKIFTGVYNGVKSAIGNLSGIGVKIVDDIISGAKSVASGIGSTILNSLKGALSSIPGINKIPGLAEGGIITKPTLAVVGEAGYPEAVVPLKNGVSADPASIMPLLSGTTTGTSATHGQSANGGTYNVQQNIYLPTGTPQQFAQETTWQLSRLVA